MQSVNLKNQPHFHWKVFQEIGIVRNIFVIHVWCFHIHSQRIVALNHVTLAAFPPCFPVLLIFLIFLLLAYFWVRLHNATQISKTSLEFSWRHTILTRLGWLLPRPLSMACRWPLSVPSLCTWLAVCAHRPLVSARSHLWLI